MRRVYQAGSLAEANLVIDMLDEAGIPSVLLNQNGISALGELPVVYPEIWIRRDPDLEKAIRVLDRFSADAVPELDIICPQCGEENLNNFEICWQCNHALPED